MRDKSYDYMHLCKTQLLEYISMRDRAQGLSSELAQECEDALRGAAVRFLEAVKDLSLSSSAAHMVDFCNDLINK